MKHTLVVMAAGLATRYGKLKQIEAVGPNAETIIDYSIYDAISAGFGRLVFVIRKSIEGAFRERVSGKFESHLETVYVHQEPDVCLNGFEPARNRKKPWGTGHAVLVVREVVTGPFVVINADDYYGRNSFKIIADFLSSDEIFFPSNYAMVGYTLRNTLSEHGYVSRGVCECGEQMLLKKVVERKRVSKTGEDIVYFDKSGKAFSLSGNEIVSMNFWGFQPSIFDFLQSQFNDFLSNTGNEPEAEFFIPTVIDNLITAGQAKVKVLTTQDRWFGITYRRDKAPAVRNIKKLIEKGIYPEGLW
ncbi:MAG: glycosyltransferase family protein [Planctomycetota bacterium]|jgi:NDP-sugar pyrophosphorylase family protein